MSSPSDLFTHKMWGGVYQISLTAPCLVKVIQPPLEWETMTNYCGWSEGMRISSDDFSDYFTLWKEGEDWLGHRYYQRIR